MYKLLEHTRRPDITFNRNGSISITARLARMLSLRTGDSINIVNHNGEFLLFSIHHDRQIGRFVAQCYPTKKRSFNFRASSVQLCRAILSAANISDNRASFMAGEPLVRNEIVYVPIITRLPL